MDANRRRARQLRKTMTEAEQRLWRCLRARQIEGFRFRRQVPIHGYIADFLCPQARLVVEVDGGQHALQSGYDAQRTAMLEGYGYRVLRYWNHDVLQNPEAVAADLHRHLMQGFAPPQSSLPLEAEERESSENT